MGKALFGSGGELNLTPVVTSTASWLTSTADRGAEFDVGQNARTEPQAPRTVGGAGFTKYRTSGNVTSRCYWRNDAGVNVLRLGYVSSTTAALHYWDGGAWVQVGDTFSWPSAQKINVRLNFSGLGTTNGSLSFKVYDDASEVSYATGVTSATGLNLTACTNIASAYFDAAGGSGRTLISAVFIQDTPSFASYVYSRAPTADGADNVDGVGTFESVNGIGGSYDTTFISLEAAGQRRSVKSGARAYNDRTVVALAANYRMRCGSTGPQSARPYLIIGGVRYYHPDTIALTTTFKNYCVVWETDPSTGAAWTKAGAESAALEWGVEAAP